MKKQNLEEWYKKANDAGKPFFWAALHIPTRAENGEWSQMAIRDSQSIGYKLPEECDRCEGSGIEFDGETGLGRECPDCNGEGD